jgi:rhodanese-related sulfurtransferase
MQTLKREELRQMIDAKEPFHLINVLDPDAFAQAHIPGSQNIPGADKHFVREVERTVGDKDATIVVYCASFDCSASPTAARKLDQSGFTQVYDYAGGIKDWREAGYPVEQGAQRRQA